MHLDALNFTILGEKLTEILLSHVLWEALDVQVASLLGALVLDGLSEALSLTISLLEGFLYVELTVFWKGLTSDGVGAVELGNCIGRALWSILAVVAVLCVEANEGK